METRNCRRWRRRAGLCGGIAAAVGVVLLLSGMLAAGATLPRCFGAAALDRLHPCSNPNLRLAVTPTPGEAVLVPNAPCTPLEPVLNVCGFGVPAAGASATIGLVGNSHAGHWRAALEDVAEALNWQGMSITRSSCPFMEASITLPEPGRVQCARWIDGIPGWFDLHPEVGTGFR